MRKAGMLAALVVAVAGCGGSDEMSSASAAASCGAPCVPADWTCAPLVPSSGLDGICEFSCDGCRLGMTERWTIVTNGSGYCGAAPAPGFLPAPCQ